MYGRNSGDFTGSRDSLPPEPAELARCRSCWRVQTSPSLGRGRVRWVTSTAPRHAATPRTVLRGRAAAGGDAEHAHRLEAEAELLAAVGGSDVQAGELADALEAVADGVAGGGKAPGGGRGGGVGLQGTPRRGPPGGARPPRVGGEGARRSPGE